MENLMEFAESPGVEVSADQFAEFAKSAGLIEDTPATPAEVITDESPDAPAAAAPPATEDIWDIDEEIPAAPAAASEADAIQKLSAKYGWDANQFNSLDELVDRISARNDAEFIATQSLQSNPGYRALSALVNEQNDERVLLGEFAANGVSYPTIKGATPEEKLQFAKDSLDPADFKELVLGVRGRHASIKSGIEAKAIQSAEQRVKSERDAEAQKAVEWKESFTRTLNEKHVLGAPLGPKAKALLADQNFQADVAREIFENPDVFIEAAIQFSKNPAIAKLREAINAKAASAVPAKVIQQIQTSQPVITSTEQGGPKIAKTLEEFLK